MNVNEVQKCITPLRLASPLGNIEFRFSVGNLCMTQENCVFYELSNGNAAVTWDLRACRAEAVCGRISPLIPENVTVEDCWALLWRVEVSQAFDEAKGVATWLPGHSWSDHGPESGQFLDALAFENASWKLLIGTEDDEALAIRAAHSNWMPERHRELLNNSYVSAQYHKDGITTRVPGLNVGERCQLQFVVAWESRSPECCAAWHAVKQSPDMIFRELREGCR